MGEMKKPISVSQKLYLFMDTQRSGENL